MHKTILLTSFTTWKPEQPSNSSDDVLLELADDHSHGSGLHFLRQLPVDFQLAPEQAIALIEQLRPDIVLLCGMAEKRVKLSLESQAVVEDDRLSTQLNLAALLAHLTYAEISHDAGQFVCNFLYYSVLKHCQTQGSVKDCLFVHVPVLTPENRPAILTDFNRIVRWLRS